MNNFKSLEKCSPKEQEERINKYWDEKNILKKTIETRDEDNNTIINIDEIVLGDAKEVELKPITYRTPNFGVFMIFNKKYYTDIPEELKIYYGDDWLVYHSAKNKKINAVANGQEIYHLGSLSSKAFNTWAYNERKIYLDNYFCKL